MSSAVGIASKLDTLSSHISTQVRAISVGVLAVAWLSLSGSDDIKAFSLGDTRWLIAIGGLCVGALCLDLLQYISGYWNLELRRLKWGVGSWVVRWLRTARFACFYGKQICAVLAAVWLVSLITIRVSTGGKVEERPPAVSSVGESRLLKIESEVVQLRTRLDMLAASFKEQSGRSNKVGQATGNQQLLSTNAAKKPVQPRRSNCGESSEAGSKEATNQSSSPEPDLAPAKL